MKKTILNAVIILVITLVIQGIINRIVFNNHGEIIESDLMQKDSITYFKSIIINNYSKQTIDNLLFRIDQGHLRKFSSNSEISVEQTNNGTLTINNIFPHRNYSIFLEIERLEPYKEPSVFPLNHEEKRIKYRNANDIKDNTLYLILSAILNSIIFAILSGIFYYYLDIKLNEYKNTVKEKIELLNKADEKFGKIKTDLDSVQNKTKKYQILSNRLNRDLIKSNEFYKILILKVIDKLKIEGLDIEKINEIINNELKTHTLRPIKGVEIDAIDIISNIVNEKTKE